MTVPAWLLVVLAIGTTARLTRLVTGDGITQRPRDWIERRGTQRGGFWHWIDELANCPWCVSIWTGFPTAFVAVWWPTNRFVLASMLALTASWVTGNTQMREPE